jgi:hypothetical protein
VAWANRAAMPSKVARRVEPFTKEQVRKLAYMQGSHAQLDCQESQTLTKKQLRDQLTCGLGGWANKVAMHSWVAKIVKTLTNEYVSELTDHWLWQAALVAGISNSIRKNRAVQDLPRNRSVTNDDILNALSYLSTQMNSTKINHYLVHLAQKINHFLIG